MAVSKTSPILTLVVGVLVSALLTGGASFIVFGQDKVSRPAMETYVHEQAPWVIERGEIQAMIRSNAEHNSKLETSVDRLVLAQQELLIEQRVLGTKVEQLIDKDN